MTKMIKITILVAAMLLIGDKDAPTDKQLEYIQHLAQIAGGEAIPGSYDDALHVINVVHNRYKSDRYPNTIYGVVKQKGQFDGYRKNNYFKPKDHHYRAAKDFILYGKRVLDEDVLHFANVAASTDKKWIAYLNKNYDIVKTNYHATVKRWQHSYYKKIN